jgi:small subunit ribosomal protein S2e
MADTAPARGGFKQGFGGERGERGGRGGRGRGRGRGRGGRGGRGRGDKEGNQKEWVPVTKLGRLVRDGKIRSLEEIYLYSLPIKEFEIIDFFLGRSLRDEVLKIMPVQKQTRAGQRTRFKAFVAIGDSNGHIGLGVKCSKEVATAIRGAIILAKLSVVPVRRGYWGNKIGKPHTVPCKVNYYPTKNLSFNDTSMMKIILNLLRFPRKAGINFLRLKTAQKKSENLNYFS